MDRPSRVTLSDIDTDSESDDEVKEEGIEDEDTSDTEVSADIEVSDNNSADSGEPNLLNHPNESTDYDNVEPFQQNLMDPSGVSEFGIEVEHKNDNMEVSGKIYFEYTCQVAKLGKQHPDPVVESTSLANISVPTLKSELRLPRNIFESGSISNVQEEALRLAIEKHEEVRSDGTRAGFLIGDGAGVGKGRIIAGVIYENYLHGRLKSIWLSVSPDLCDVAQKDFNDIGSDIPVLSLKKFANSTNDFKHGVLFCTYSALVQKPATKQATRLDEVVKWFGKLYDGVIALDESHRAKNRVGADKSQGSLFGEMVYKLQELLPKARVLYISATGASEPRNMLYMSRIGIWGPDGLFSSQEEFIKEMNERDVCGMELLAMHLKSRGSYIARQLSYNGWTKMFQCLAQHYKGDFDNWRFVISSFWSAHQRFFKHLCVASKVERTLQIARTELKNGNCVVIGLQSTGESNFDKTREDGKDAYAELVSTSSLILTDTLSKCFGAKPSNSDDSSDDDQASSNAPIASLWKEARKLSSKLPKNTIDEIILKLYGPDKVSELTARRGRLVYGNEGKFLYQRRSGRKLGESVNQSERLSFMRGEKLIAIVSDAASTGISLHADARAANKRTRVHITLELPWSADKAIQQFGRTHRSNQVVPPIYVLLVSELAGDTRFASGVAKRLESLGALGHGDRRAGVSTDLAQFNFENQYGEKAVSVIVEIAVGSRKPMMSAEHCYENFFETARKGMDDVGIISGNTCNVPKFLNRLLGLPVKLQNDLFNYFAKTVSAMVIVSKKMGRYDRGILDMNLSGVTEKEIVRTFTSKHGTIVLEQMITDRGMSWDTAYSKYLLSHDSIEGFYSSRFANKELVVLVLEDIRNEFATYRPSTGRGFKLETITDVLGRKKISLTEAQLLWNNQYDHASSHCYHKFLFNGCKFEKEGATCEFGRRWKKQYLLTGQLLTIWPLLRSVLHAVQVVRVPSGMNKVVGVLVEENETSIVIASLEKFETENE